MRTRTLAILVIVLGSFASAYGQTSTDTLNNVLYVGGSLTRWGTGDIGSQINNAYAALPATGGTIYLIPKSDGTCYTFTQGIQFTTNNKYVRLMYAGSNGVNTDPVTLVSTPQGCLNYTPSSGSAITLDYASKGGLSDTSAHGISNIMLIGSDSTGKPCFSFGGCGGSAVGVDTGTTNQGSLQAYMDNVSIIGFHIGYKNLNVNSVGVVWNNPQLSSNNVAVLMANNNPIMFNYGTYVRNGTIFKSDSTGVLAVYGSYLDMFGNGTVVDGTASPIGGGFNCSFCHFEASTAGQTPFINGPVNVVLVGGLMEVDIAGGTVTQFINASGAYIHVNGMQFASSATVTAILTANSNLKGQIGGEIIGSNFGTPYVNGANAGHIGTYFTGAGALATIPTFIENLNTPTLELGTGGGLIIDEDGIPPAVAAKDVCFGSRFTHSIQCNYNNTSFFSLTQTIASGTFTLRTAAIASNSCAATVTVAGTGILTTDVVQWSFNSDPSGITGYGAGSTGTLSIWTFPTSGNANVRVCNLTAGSITPGAATLSWKVVR